MAYANSVDDIQEDVVVVDINELYVGDGRTIDDDDSYIAHEVGVISTATDNVESNNCVNCCRSCLNFFTELARGRCFRLTEAVIVGGVVSAVILIIVLMLRGKEL